MLIQIVDGQYVLCGTEHTPDMETEEAGQFPTGELDVLLARGVAYVYVGEEFEKLNLVVSVFPERPHDLASFADPGMWPLQAQGVVQTDSPLEIRTLEHSPEGVVTATGGTFEFLIVQRTLPQGHLSPGETPLQQNLFLWPTHQREGHSEHH